MFWLRAGLFIMCWRGEKKSGTKEASEREPGARLGSFLHPSRLQLPISSFICPQSGGTSDRPTDREGCMHAWMDGWMQWGLFFGRIGDVEETSSRWGLRLSLRGKKNRWRRALGDISCPLLYQDFNLFFKKAGIEVDFKSFLELLFIQLFCSTLTGLFYRIIRTLLTMYAIAKSLLFVLIIMYKNSVVFLWQPLL